MRFNSLSLGKYQDLKSTASVLIGSGSKGKGQLPDDKARTILDNIRRSGQSEEDIWWAKWISSNRGYVSPPPKSSRLPILLTIKEVLTLDPREIFPATIASSTWHRC